MQPIVETAKKQLSQAQSFLDFAKVFATLFKISVPGQAPPKDPNDYKNENSDYGLKLKGVKTRERLNEQAREILDRVKNPEDLTAEDREILKQYSGQGGLTDNSQFEYYTPQHVAEGCWDALKANGIESGNILDPSTGHGMYSATKPKGVIITGCDIDPTSSRIAQLLNPDDQITNQSFEKFATTTPDNSFDAVMTNVPFGKARGKYMHDDPAYKSEKYIHRYFLARIIDKLKPGGLAVLVVPIDVVGAKGDNRWAKFRTEISKKAEFLGAHKLPSKTFKAQGTDTVVDVVVFKKHPQDLLDKIDAIPFDTLQKANVIFDQFVKGTYWQGEGRPYIMGKYVPKVDGDRWSRETVDGDVDDAGLKAKLAARFNSRIDWGMLESAEAIVRNYVDGDRKLMNGAEYEMVHGVWQKIVSVEASETIDAAKYGAGSIEELKSILQNPKLCLKLTAAQAFAIYKAFPELMGALAKAAIEFAMSQKKEDYIEQLWRGSLIGGMLGRYQATVDEGGDDESERLALQDLVTAEIAKYGHPSHNKGLSLTGESSRAYGLFRNAVDTKGTFSDLLNGTLEGSGNALEYDSTNLQSIVEQMFLKENITTITLEDVQKLYTGEKEITTLGDLADCEEVAITPDGLIQPFFRYTSGDIYPKIDAMQEAMALETDLRIIAAYQRQIQAIMEKRKVTPLEDVDFSLQQKWIPRDLVKQFLEAQGWAVRYGSVQTVEVEDAVTGRMRKSSKFVEDYDTPFGEWQIGATAGRGYNKEISWNKKLTGFDLRLEGYLNGRSITHNLDSGDLDAQAQFREREAALNEGLTAFIQTHPDVETVLERFNRKFNSFVPFEYDTSDLKLKGVTDAITLHTYQNAGVRRLSEEGSGILAFQVGLGKAQDLNAKILTPDGWKRMGDMQVGDKVMAWDGSVTTVTGVFPQGDREMFEVEFSDGAKTKCCDEHLWFTQTENDRGKERYYKKTGRDVKFPGTAKQLSEIKTSLVVGAKQKNHIIPMVKPLEFGHRELPLSPYLLGVLLGDGSIGHKHITYTKNDKDLAEKVSALVGAEFGDTLALIKRDNPKRADTYGFSKPDSLSKNPLKTILTALGLHGLLSNDKFIPHEYLFASMEQRLALFHGLMDTDGYVSKDGITVQFSSSSRQLADGVVHLVQSFGGLAWVGSKIPTFTHKGEKKEGSECFTVSIRMPAEIAPFTLARKADRVRPKTKYLPVRHIVAVRPVGTEPAQCIMVDHPDHLYVTDDFIVTHNTFTALALNKYNQQMGRSKRTCIVVPASVLSNWYHDAKTLYGNMDDVLFVGVQPETGKDGTVMVEPVLDEQGQPKTDKSGNIVYKDKLRNANSAEEVYADMWRIPQSNYKTVVMTKDRFKLIPVKPETVGAYAEDMKAALENSKAGQQAMEASKGKKKGKSYAEDVEDAQNDARFHNEGTEKEKAYPFLEDMGFSDIIVDEAHSAKNLMGASSRFGRTAYLPNPVVSQIGMDMSIKMHHIKKMNNNRGVVLLTATPITNSLIECYNMLSLVVPKEEFERRDIYTVDDFIVAFGSIQPVDKLNTENEMVSVDGLTGYQNLEGLRDLFFKYCNAKSPEDVEELRTALPEADRQDLSVEITGEQKALYDMLREQGKKSKKRSTPKEEKRPLFAIIRDMDKVTTDLDLYYNIMTWHFPVKDKDKVDALIASLPASVKGKGRPEPGDDGYDYEKTEEQQKVQEIEIRLEKSLKTEVKGNVYVVVTPQAYEDNVLNRLDKYKLKGEDISHPITPKYAALIENCKKEMELGGKQIIFSEEKGQHKKIVRLFVHNIPALRNRIGIINAEEAAGNELQKISDAYNAGALLYVICNRKAEVGVNLQKGTTAIHHLTFPWTKAAMIQRDGRGLRQGNTAKKVTIYKYQGAGTFDMYRMDLIEHKGALIDDLVSGQGNRTVNQDANEDAGLSLMLEDNPEAAKRAMQEKAAQKAALDAERVKRSLFNQFQAFAANSEALVNLEASREKKRAELQSTIEYGTKNIEKLRSEGMRYPEGDSNRKWYSEKIQEEQRRVEKATTNLASLDYRYDQQKSDLDRKVKQAALTLRAKAKKGELPFDASLLDRPDNCVISPDGKTIITVGDMFELSRYEGATVAVIKVTSVKNSIEQEKDGKTFTLPYKGFDFEMLVGNEGGMYGSSDLPVRARKTDGLVSLTKFLNRDSTEPFPIKVNYSEKELALIKVLAKKIDDYGEIAAMVDKDTFNEYYDKLQFGYFSYVGRVGDSLGLFYGIPDRNAPVAYPEVDNENFRKTVAQLYLANLREGGMDDYRMRDALTAVFGKGYRAAAQEYGQKATEADVIKACQAAWTAYLKDAEYGEGEAIPPIAVVRAAGDIKAAAMALGDNQEEISAIVQAFNARMKEDLLAKEAEAAREEELRKQAELRNDPNYKEVPEDVKAAFERIGLKVRVNTVSTYLPNSGGFRAQTVPPFSRWFLQDPKAKNGVLYRLKEQMKSRFGAAYCSNEGEFSGSWWHIPSTTDLAKVYEFLA